MGLVARGATKDPRMWDPPGPGIEPVSPALAGGLLTTAPPGKSLSQILDQPKHVINQYYLLLLDMLCLPRYTVNKTGAHYLLNQS